MQNRTKIKKTVTQDRTIGIKLDSLKILRYFEIVTTEPGNRSRCLRCLIVILLRITNLRKEAPRCTLAAGREKEGVSLQQRLWNLNSASNSPVAPRRLNCQISANQREAETRANVHKHCKARNSTRQG